MIELVIYIALTAAIALMLTSFLVSIMKGKNHFEQRREVNDNARIALERVRSDISTAQSVTAAGDGVLTLARADGTTVSLNVDQGILYRQVDTSAAVAVTTDTVFIDNFLTTDIPAYDPAHPHTVQTALSAYVKLSPEIRIELSTTYSLPSR